MGFLFISDRLEKCLGDMFENLSSVSHRFINSPSLNYIMNKFIIIIRGTVVINILQSMVFIKESIRCECRVRAAAVMLFLHAV